MAEAVSEFAAKWNLDSQATDFLSGLDEAAVNIIIAEFGPRGDTQNVASKLYAFARSVTSRLSTGTTVPGYASAQVGPDLESFTAKWNIDAAGVSWLYSLPPKVTAVLVQEFEPKEGTQNPIGKLKAFARSIQQGQETQVSHGNGRYPTVSAATSSPWHRANEFCTYWGIEETAKQLLHSMPPDTQATVISEFDPKGATHNITGKFVSFARSVAGSRQGSEVDVVNSFATYWGLDESTTAFLYELPEEARSTVIQQFDPKPGTSNINGKLRMFAKGICAQTSQTFFAGRAHTEASAGWGTSTGGLDKSAWSTSTGGLDKSASGPDAALTVVDEEATALAAASTSDPAISSFVLRWHLDQSSVSLLEGLPESVRATVLEQFDPRAGTHNLGAKLRAFANTVLNGKGRSGKGSAGGLDGVSGTSPSPHVAPTWAKANSAAEPSQEEEDAFLLKWDLQDNQQAKDVLKRLQGHLRARVMREFLPGEATTNVFGKFCGFANSVSKFAAREAWPPAASHSYGAGYGAAAPNYKGYSAAGGSALVGYGGNAKGYARATSSAQQFAEQWQLDEGSRAVLQGLPPDVQAIVIAEFQPRGDTRDIGAKFTGFARSVATRGRGQKRPWPGGGPTQPTWR